MLKSIAKFTPLQITYTIVITIFIFTLKIMMNNRAQKNKPGKTSIESLVLGILAVLSSVAFFLLIPGKPFGFNILQPMDAVKEFSDYLDWIKADSFSPRISMTHTANIPTRISREVVNEPSLLLNASMP